MKTDWNKPIILGNVSNHQWGIVVDKGGVLPTLLAEQSKRGFPGYTVRKWSKKDLTDQTNSENALTRQDKTRQDKTRQILIVGTIGNTERQNRDNMRVISGKGLMYALKAHIDKEQPMVLKKYSKFTRH